METNRLYHKYTITKADGSAIDDDAQYFVLRVDTDPHSFTALYAYALVIKDDQPELALDILGMISEYWGDWYPENETARRIGDFLYQLEGGDLKLDALSASEPAEAALASIQRRIAADFVDSAGVPGDAMGAVQFVLECLAGAGNTVSAEIELRDNAEAALAEANAKIARLREAEERDQSAIMAYQNIQEAQGVSISTWRNWRDEVYDTFAQLLPGADNDLPPSAYLRSVAEQVRQIGQDGVDARAALAAEREAHAAVVYAARLVTDENDVRDFDAHARESIVNMDALLALREALAALDKGEADHD